MKNTSVYISPKLDYVSLYASGALLVESYGAQNEDFSQGAYIDLGDDIVYL
ncbi:MAG: hypothetical protein IJS62_09320 [Bacteroidales bacterium]|nr:hypothetical protein [Bacteroidales bacterium]